MQNINPTRQLELFSENCGLRQTKINRSYRNLVGYILGYEKAILLLIGFIITAVVSFSLGVEKQKRDAAQATRLDLALPRTPKDNYPQEKPAVLKEANPLYNYTVQVASYQSRAFAQKEADLLQKKGLSYKIISKKGGLILCVGNFSDKKMALSLLSELKERYPDCFIRRL